MDTEVRAILEVMLGAKFAVDATKECVDEFVSEIDKGIFVGKSFTQKKSVSFEAQSNILSKDTTTDKALRQLFSSIIFKWREKNRSPCS